MSSSVLIHCKGILFDMDGILISSIGSVVGVGRNGQTPRRRSRITRKTAHGRRAVETIAISAPILILKRSSRSLKTSRSRTMKASLFCPACTNPSRAASRSLGSGHQRHRAHRADSPCGRRHSAAIAPHRRGACHPRQAAPRAVPRRRRTARRCAAKLRSF